MRLVFDGIYYCDLVPVTQLPPAIPQISGQFVFHQDIAPATISRQFEGSLIRGFDNLVLTLTLTLVLTLTLALTLTITLALSLTLTLTLTLGLTL